MSWVVLAFLSAVFAALTAIFAKIGIKGVDSNLATAIRTSIVVIFTWVIVIAQQHTADITKLTRTTWIFLILSAFATGLSWLFYFKALQIGDVNKVVPIDKFSLVLTIILSAVILHEKLTLPVIMGTLLMTAGTLVIVFGK